MKGLARAAADIRHATTADLRTADGHTLLANIGFAMGSVDQAKTEPRAVIATNPRNVAILGLL